MGGIRLGGHATAVECPGDTIGPAFVVVNDTNETGPFGERNWDDVWLVPAGAPGGATVGSSPCTQVTDNHDNAEFGVENYDDQPYLGGCGRVISYVQYDDVGDYNGDVKTVNTDGSNDAFVDPTPGAIQSFDHQQPLGASDDDLVLNHFNGAHRLDVPTATETSIVGVGVGSASWDGTKFAYMVDGGGSNWELRSINPDGTGDTALVTGLGNLSFPGPAVWFKDDSRILFPTLPLSGSGWRLRSCLPDGSDVRTEESNAVGFWWEYGMYDDGAGGDPRLFYTEDTVVAGPNLPGTWQLYEIPLDGASGKSAVTVTSPSSGPLSIARASQRGVAHVRQGRVFTIIDSEFYGGTEDFVSVLPDGSDYRVHFAPAEGVGPTNLFQVPVLR